MALVRDDPDLKIRLVDLLGKLELAQAPSGAAVVAACMLSVFTTLGLPLPPDDVIMVWYDVLCPYPEDILRHVTRQILREVFQNPTPSDWARRAEPIYQARRHMILRIRATLALARLRAGEVAAADTPEWLQTLAGAAFKKITPEEL